MLLKYQAEHNLLDYRDLRPDHPFAPGFRTMILVMIKALQRGGMEHPIRKRHDPEDIPGHFFPTGCSSGDFPTLSSC